MILRFVPLLAVALFPVFASPLSADEVKLKSGQTITGRILFESDDMVRIETAASASIKETKTIARADIESVSKDAPDLVAFKALESLLPTGSLVSADAYKKMLETGPDSFLRQFPESSHAAKVKEMRDQIAAELDKVERGFIKVDGDWYSPQDKLTYREMIAARIRLIQMQANAKRSDLNGWIAAMREYEQLEKYYFGSPAFAKAIPLALEVIPKLGRQLQSLAATVDHTNAEAQRAIDLSSAEVRAQILAARAREEQMISSSVATDKKAGLKWVQLNQRSKTAIDEYLRTAAAELTRIRTYDVAKLTQAGEQLVAVDQLIASDKIREAEAKLTVAKALIDPKQMPKAGTRSKDAKTAPVPGSYFNALEWKIADLIDAEKKKAAEQAARSKSAELAATVKKSTNVGEEKPANPEAVGKEMKEGEVSEVEKKSEAPADDFAALSRAKNATEKDRGANAQKGKSQAKGKVTEKAADMVKPSTEAAEPPATPPSDYIADDESHLSLIIFIATGVLVLVIVVLKVLGIGKKKEEGDDE